MSLVDINFRGNRRGNHEWTIQRKRRHRAHKTQDEDKQSKKHNTENQKNEQHGPHQKPGVNSGACETYFCLYHNQFLIKLDDGH